MLSVIICDITIHRLQLKELKVANAKQKIVAKMYGTTELYTIVLLQVTQEHGTMIW